MVVWICNSDHYPFLFQFQWRIYVDSVVLRLVFLYDICVFSSIQGKQRIYHAGKKSYGMFLTHMFFAHQLSAILSRFGRKIGVCQTLCFAIAYMITITGNYCASGMLNKLNEKVCKSIHLSCWIYRRRYNMKTVFITGASGFIGSNLAKRILTTELDTTVIGLDNMNDYYDVRIKETRLEELQKFENYTFIKGNLADKALINSIFERYHPDIVVNLGAQAGVCYSITNPDAYIESNMIGFYNILEACRHYPVEHLVFASSSSVYGSNKKVPYSTDDKVDNPVSLYAATKKSNDLMAHAYSKLYNIPSTGLRFFTVYGPAGRPDMAYFGFTNKLVNGETIKIFNYGNCKRDFTYKERHVVENFFLKIKEFRRVAMRFDKLAKRFYGFVVLAAVHVLLA